MKTKSFLVGALVGALVSALIHVFLFRPQRHFGPRPPDPQTMQQMLLDRFTRELSLTSEQKEQISPVVIDLHKKMLALRLSQESEIDKLMSQTDDEVAKYLSPEQQKKFVEVRERFKERRKKDEEFLKSGGGMPPPPHMHDVFGNMPPRGPGRDHPFPEDLGEKPAPPPPHDDFEDMPR